MIVCRVRQLVSRALPPEYIIASKNEATEERNQKKRTRSAIWRKVVCRTATCVLGVAGAAMPARWGHRAHQARVERRSRDDAAAIRFLDLDRGMSLGGIFS